jgi:cob(I)alamin adenosyltransferase
MFGKTRMNTNLKKRAVSLKGEEKKDKAPREHRIPKKRPVKKGLILVNTGGGKGKSTAAFGTAMRAAGCGMKVAVIQFIKGKWKTGEEKSAKKLGIKFIPMGEGFTWDTQSFDRDVRAAKRAWKLCQKMMKDKTHHLVVFDEINYCLKYNFLDVKEVLQALAKKPPMKHVFLTGGGAPQELIDAADLVTEMKCIKHPYEQGVLAQQGIEF